MGDILSLEDKFERTGDISCLSKAIALAKKLVASGPSDRMHQTVLILLNGMLEKRFDWTERDEDLREVIELAEEIVTEGPPDHPDRPLVLNNLGNHLKIRYERLGYIQDLEHAIKWTKESVAATSLDHPSRALRLSNLGNNLEARYERLGDLEDLEQAVKWSEEAVSAIPPEHPDRVGLLSTLGRRLESRFERLGDLQDLEQAIKRSDEAVSGTLSGDPNYAGRLSSLGIMLGTKFERLGDLKDLEQAIKRSEEAIAATPLDHPSRVGRLGNLGNKLELRFDRLGDLKDLEQAILLSEEVVAETPLGHPDRAGVLDDLSNKVASRYDRLGDLRDLGQAIKWSEEAVIATSQDHPERGAVLGNLGNRFVCRYERLGDLQDLNKAIKWSGQSVAATLPDHPDYALRLSNLGSSLAARYSRLGDIQDLTQAIKRGEEAVAATRKDHAGRADILSSLSAHLSRRYDRFGDLQDLQQAIKWSEEAVNATPHDHPGCAALLNNLGSDFWNRYIRLQDIQDLEQSIRLSEEAIAATPLDHPHRAAWLGALGTKLGNRYARLQNLPDLEQAIRLCEEAVAATPLDHPDRSGGLSSLGNQLARRYDRLGNLQDLDQAIQQSEEAVAAKPSDHPRRAQSLDNLALLLSSRYKKSHSTQDFYYILRLCYAAWHFHTATPTVRIRAACRAASILAASRMWQESSSLLEGAVRMLPNLSSRSLGRDDQEYRLSKFNKLIAETISITLQAGSEASHCLRLLELGRGIIMGLTIDCRLDLSELQMKHPKQFDKFHRLRIEVDSPKQADSFAQVDSLLVNEDLENREYNYQLERDKRTKAVHELEEVLASIRELPGFEGFQLPPRSKDLMTMACEGPIVIFNSTAFRSDAIIVTSSAIESLALPNLHYSLVEENMGQIAKLTRGKRSTYHLRNKKMDELLLWLWNVAVEPVFSLLQLDTLTNNKVLPRIWWIGVGKLAVAPFHAAGDHSPGSTRNTISKAISSYIPTIKALSYARQRKLELLSEAGFRLLLVTMPTTPGQSPLPNSTKEVEDIMDVVKGKATTARLDRPSTAQVLKELQSYHALHFACHGLSNSRSPSDSHLLLCKDDGSKLGISVIDKLTVGAISNIKLQNAQIAYLSACSTAENASTTLADESIYIASGFQLAGFSHVLATQWVSNDAACRQVARDFYNSLFSDQLINGVHQGHNKVSAAFHLAVKALRDQNLRQPIKWASFIHTGA